MTVSGFEWFATCYLFQTRRYKVVSPSDSVVSPSDVCCSLGIRNAVWVRYSLSQPLEFILFSVSARLTTVLRR